MPETPFTYNADPFSVHRPWEMQECPYSLRKEIEDANAPKPKKRPVKKKKTPEEIEEENKAKEEEEEWKRIEEEEKKKLEAEAKKLGKRVKIVVAEEPVP